MNENIRKGDPVIIIAGKNKGKKGEITKVDKDNGRVFVEGDKAIKGVIKHVKPKKAQDKGGRIEQPASVDSSNVMLVCPSCGEPTRVGSKVVKENGKDKKVRICKKCGAVIEAAKAQKAAAKKAPRKKKATAADEKAAETEVKTEKQDAAQQNEQAVK
jgi:large subunit ribosomal protein L24